MGETHDYWRESRAVASDRGYPGSLIPPKQTQGILDGKDDESSQQTNLYELNPLWTVTRSKARVLPYGKAIARDRLTWVLKLWVTNIYIVRCLEIYVFFIDRFQEQIRYCFKRERESINSLFLSLLILSKVQRKYCVYLKSKRFSGLTAQNLLLSSLAKGGKL